MKAKEPEGKPSERPQRIRDAVEAALSDIILLGAEEQVRLAAAAEMAAGKPIHTAELVVSLRTFIRRALDLAPVPEDVAIPRQGPARQLGGGGGGKGGKGGKDDDAGGGGGGGMGGGGLGGDMGGMGLGGLGHHEDDYA